MTTKKIMQNACGKNIVIPGFNIPYLPMMEPVVNALRDTKSFGLIMVARLEWVKFQSKSIRTISDEYNKVKDENFTRLHLDHIPVIDEDNKKVDYLSDIREALELGYQSVMIDGSRLALDENIMVTKQVVGLAHQYKIPVEAELGAVMGHEEGPMPPYEELFASGKGFTSSTEAVRFVKETNVDWLSVAIGNVHGAISQAKKDSKKVEARLNIEHLRKIYDMVKIPLVLHGGTGIRNEYILKSFQNGIAKINIATAIRQPYEKLMNTSVKSAQDAVYNEVVRLVTNDFGIAGKAGMIL
jgi:ketose-bisphosphate aldolase